MTPEEYLLIVTMLTKQQQLLQTLANILKSRDLVSSDDLAAFEFAGLWNVPEKDRVIEMVKKAYLQNAETLGIDTGLAS